MKVHVSLGALPGVRLQAALEKAMAGLTEPLIGALSTEQVQLVPQTPDVLTLDGAAELRRRWPSTRFRLHANVRILPDHRFADLSCMDRHLDWWRQAARVSMCLDAPAYTAHAGRRRNARLREVFDNTKRAADLFGCAVGIEGLYPAAGDMWLLSTWGEYRELLDSGLPYALDLSHVHILSVQSGRMDPVLVGELLASPACIELHISDNDGCQDSHWPCARPAPWWSGYLRSLNPRTVVFSEGNQRHLLKGQPT